MTPPAQALDETAAAATLVLEEEARRHAEEGREREELVLADDLLPGVGDRSMPLREVLSTGGVSMVAVLALLNLVDEFDRVALAVLGPDIQESLGMSDAVLGAVAGVGGLLLVLGAVPLGYLADRTRRTSLVSICTALWSVVALLTGLVREVWQLVVTRILSGLGKANVLPVHNSLLADAYPIAGRARVFGLHNLANPVGVALGPLLAGGLAAWIGGDEGWRWAFVVLAAPGLVLALVALGLREPARGHNEQKAVLGEAFGETADELPISLSAGFARLRKVRTFHHLLLGVGALGFALFSIPTFFNLLLEDRYGLDAFDRGVMESFRALGGLVGVPLGGFLGDRLFRRSPSLVMQLIAAAMGGFGFVFVAALYLPALWMVVAGAAVAHVLLSMAFVPLNALVAAITPYRLRALGFAMIGIYIFLFGSFFGGVITGAISDALGERAALAIVVPPSAAFGALLVALGARHVRRDISLVVQELTEERDERARLRARGATAPVLQVRNLDFSYGSVQVLFDVAVDVHEGEVLALLGTNGAGKSTLLRAISGLGIPDRGVVRLDGRTITYTEAEERVRLGIVQVPGGKAVFPSLTVAENLLAGAYSYAWDQPRLDAAAERVLTLFPRLDERLDQPAGTLSGGEQQMLGLAKALLLEPRVLLIDELSLGLAPVVVQELLAVVERLKADGTTMVIVEQSVNVALTMADRAVFMEKGQVRFTGAAADLLERDDLVRAVFLGGEGG